MTKLLNLPAPLALNLSALVPKQSKQVKDSSLSLISD